jgi:hypothetical protein
VKLKLLEAAVDYVPVVTSEIYDRVFHNIKEKVKKPITKEEKQFKTSLRGLLYFGEVIFATQESTGLNKQQTLSVIGKEISLSML